MADAERRVKADPELADEGGVIFCVTGQAFQESRGAGAGDGAQIFDQFIAAHADAIVGNGDRFVFFGGRNLNLEFSAAFQ